LVSTILKQLAKMAREEKKKGIRKLPYQLKYTSTIAAERILLLFFKAAFACLLS
jgi:hypothetical protein